MQIEVFTDGSAQSVDRPGGWAYIIIINGQKKTECAGYMPGASNNDAELEAAIQGLGYVFEMMIKSPSSFPLDWEVTLVSDSQLVLGWANGRYRFKQANKLHKYETLKRLVKKLNIKTRWVQGHSGDEHNERCDKLANQARLSVNRGKEIETAKITGDTLIGTKKNGVVNIWYKGQLKIVDLESNLIENYDRSKHGARGGILEIREEKSR